MPVCPRCHYAHTIKSPIFVISLAVTATHSILARLSCRLKCWKTETLQRRPDVSFFVRAPTRSTISTHHVARFTVNRARLSITRRHLGVEVVSPPPSLSPRTRALVSRLCAKFSLSFSHPKMLCVCALEQLFTTLIITVLCRFIYAFFRFRSN